MESLTHLLNNYMKSNTHGGVNGEIAAYILANISRMPEMKRSDIAQNCHVSDPSVTRFCKELGFVDFIDFKFALMEQRKLLVEDPPAANPYPLTNEKTFTRNVDSFSNILAKLTQDALRQVDMEKIKKVSKDIVTYQNVVCIGMGLSSMFGDFLNSRLSFKNKGLRSIGLPDCSRPLTGDKKRTLAILVSQSGQIIVNNKGLTAYLRKNADAVWFITQSEVPVTDDKINHIIYLKKCGIYNVDYHIMLTIAELIGQFCDMYYNK